MKSTIKHAVTGLRRVLIALALITAVLQFAAHPGIASTLYWDTDPGTSGLGGTGGWSISATNWNVNSNGAVVTPGAVWQQNATSPYVSAYFDGTPGIVTINGNATVNVNNMTFNVDGYSIQRQPFNNNESITVDPTLGTTITVTNAAYRAIIEPALIGSGAVTIAGPGIVQFYRYAQNTYSGGTFVNDGTLELNKLSGFGINLAIPGNLTIGDGIGAAGSAVVRNLNIAQISNGNNYTVTINRDGWYDVNSQGEIIDRLVMNGGLVTTGSLSFLQVTQGSLDYALKMTGGTISGDAPLHLSGDLWATSGSTAVISTPVDLLGSTRTFNVVSGDSSIDLLVSGAISDGTLIKAGDGVLALTGANTYTGHTTVEAGTLVIDGSVTSRIEVQSGATLEGAGTTTLGIHIDSGATMYPIDRFGNPSTFTLTTDNDYTQLAGGTFKAAIRSGGNYSRLEIPNGDAELAGNLSIVRMNNFVPTNVFQGFQIIYGGENDPKGINGVFTNTFVKTNGQYGQVGNGDGVYLDSSFSQFSQQLPVLTKVDFNNNDVTVRFVADFELLHGLTFNESAVAAALDNHVGDNNSTVQKVINLILNDKVSNMPGDLDLLAPEEFTALFQIGISGATVQNANIMDRCEYLRLNCGCEPVPASDGKTVVGAKDGKHFVQSEPAPERKWEFFVAGSGEFTNLKGDGNADGYNFTTAGVTVGGDYRINQHLAVGLFGGYANTDADLVNNGTINANSGFGGLFATFCDKGWYADAIVSGGYTSFDTTRTGLPYYKLNRSGLSAQGPGLPVFGSAIANGDATAGAFSTMIRGGYDFKKSGFTFGPFATLQYTYVDLGSFTEAGSLAPLSFDSQSQDSLLSQVGAHVAYEFQMCGMTVRPHVRVAWQHEYLYQTLDISSHIAGTGVGYTVRGPEIGSDSAIVGAGVAVDITPAVTVYTEYQGDLGRSNYDQQSVFGGVVVKF